MPGSRKIESANLPSRGSAAFTLVELLVVVAVIALLVAMLLPTLQKAKDKGKQAVCMGNLRQIYTGFALYATDWEDAIPGVGYWNSGCYNGTGRPWFAWLGDRGYFGSTEVWPNWSAARRWKVLQCPGEGRPSGSLVRTAYFEYVQGPSAGPNNPAGGYGCSYALNWYVSNYDYCGFRKSFFRGPDDGNRSDSPFVVDCENFGDGWVLGFFLDIHDPGRWNYTGGWSGFSHAFRHPGRRANMLYMDGHVASVRHVIDGGAVSEVYKVLWASPP